MADKRESEFQPYTISFAQQPRIIAGKTIASIVSIIATVTNGPAGASLPTLSNQGVTADGKMVTVWIGGGTANTTYKINVTVLDNGTPAAEMEAEMPLTVLP